jgi:hypothetical protein
MAAILKELHWTFAVVVYTNDNYGIMGSRLLLREAKALDICINASIAIGNDMVAVVTQLMLAKQQAGGGSLAVVYIGEKDRAENLVFNLKARNGVGQQTCECVLLLFLFFCQRANADLVGSLKFIRLNL